MHGYIVNPQAITPIYTKVEIPSLKLFTEKEREGGRELKDRETQEKKERGKGNKERSE